MPLILDTGSSTNAGKSSTSSDAYLIAVPDIRAAKRRAVLAIADSLDDPSEEGEASRFAVKTLRDSFYAAPKEWKAEQALKKSFAATNRAMASKGNQSGASTLSALTLDGNQWAFGHLGNTRIWLYRDDKLKLLTHDHTEHKMGEGQVVTQACGLSDQADIEIGGGDIQEQDVFVLTSNGIHDVLTSAIIMSCIMKGETAQEMAGLLVKQAIDAHGDDDMSACVAIVDRLPDKNESKSVSVIDTISALPIGPLPKKGDVIDGYQIQQTIQSGRTTMVYKCIEQKSGDTVALRFPNPKFADDHEFIDAFLREEWIGKQYDSPYLIKVKSLGGKKRSVLYSVLEYHRGESLKKRIRRKEKLSVRESLFLIMQLLKCVDFLHNKGICHTDIKPNNIYIDREKKRLMLVGFGLSSIDKMDDGNTVGYTYEGNKSFRAPEILQGYDSDKRADIYSIGATLYHMLTEKYPYGRISKVSDKSFAKFQSPDIYNRKIPKWLYKTLRQACAPKSNDRFQSIAAFSKTLHNPVQDGSDREPEENGKSIIVKLPAKQIIQWALIATVVISAMVLMFMYL